MNEGLKKIAEISRFYGCQKEFVIAGGGNTSYKTDDRLWVKASGFALSTITEEGFAMLDRAKLAEIASKTYSSDASERENQVKNDLAAANLTPEKRPSVETSMHDAIDYSYVVHLHPTLVNGVMCANDVEKYLEPVFGPEALYIPYIDPGYILFKEVEKRILAYRKDNGFDPKVILLQNHGIFVSANEVDEIKEIYSKVIESIKNNVKKDIPESDIEISDLVTSVVPAIRMIASESELKTVQVRNNGLIRYFSGSADAFSRIEKPFTPDIIVYCKSKYIYIDEVESAKTIISEFQLKFNQFVSENGYPPKVVVVRNLGLLAIGDTSAQTDIILDVFEDLLKISWLSESFGGQHFMTDAQISFIDNWEVENYRRSIAAVDSKGRVENLTIIVTGAAQGFGEGIARELKEQGANIVVADLNETKGNETAELFNSLKGGNKAIFVKTDVSDIDQIKLLVKATVSRFGAIDAFISNAGILRAGGLDEMTPESFDLVTKINYNAYFYCTKVVSEVMKLQTSHKSDYYADIIQINSKSGLSGSKKNFAYAGGKFGGIGLTQSFALELAADRIKVNSVCPGNFYDGPLWSDPENGLFVQYLNAGKVPGAKSIDDVKNFYLGQTPIQRGCTVKDVVKGVIYLIDQEFETGQALPVTGGQIMLK
ncbi:SDR family NAD(P)-dependent oxidoreductase [Natronoflexus pectinivorans]|uniref:Rhamnose utilization protein RhaD (Predicted bifunctional aldolase and dehydrogenase) n=1 Tax=Natronoflexus pectinivorans TaxID=682526 RepID=A0A4R2GHT3_9BACT|nr:SDR family NAD(P)-dependent oxidoreductase [Natronoflexus pectinivorans]TCO07731.1 rhamnose utilization protein RhaD (predicted bifunctional aldolase and dehydrogenase) [Natronoflexus pectinivorans]